MKATLRFKVRLERMENERLVRKVYLWNLGSSRWGKKCFKMVVNKSGMMVRWMNQPREERVNAREWQKT